MMPSNCLILCRPLLLLPSIFPSISVFSNESALCLRWPKYWNFSFNISPSNEYSELISFRIDWFDFLAVQGTLKEVSPAPQFKSIVTDERKNGSLSLFPFSPIYNCSREPLKKLGSSPESNVTFLLWQKLPLVLLSLSVTLTARVREVAEQVLKEESQFYSVLIS